jgi:hypothetical protein
MAMSGHVDGGENVVVITFALASKQRNLFYDKEIDIPINLKPFEQVSSSNLQDGAHFAFYHVDVHGVDYEPSLWLPLQRNG